MKAARDLRYLSRDLAERELLEIESNPDDDRLKDEDRPRYSAGNKRCGG
ncbi:hypothetical protein [Bradyrhizobium cenepequi]|nr:hypothetical protein [Bradyrhizobium cenepequi]MCA6112504.1 hypothetical protein [Bradyrhizobium cenepequi]